MIERSAGILMHITSLPSPYGVGTLGRAARAFADFLEQAGQRFWQVLPVGPTGSGDSPYQSFSSFAGNPYLIDLELLEEEGLLAHGVSAAIDWGSDPEQVDYGRLYRSRFAVLRQACDVCRRTRQAELARFAEEQRYWLEDYALFMALKVRFGMRSWLEWPDEALRLREPSALEAARRELAEDTAFFTCLQYLFYRQWDALRTHCRSRGVQLIGDVPFYVSVDSADVWSQPQFFQLDAQRRPTHVAGVPPDYFSKNGQLWGNPLYDWEAMAADGYGWWIRRIGGMERLFDWVRVDHFRGFSAYWSVPAGAETAAAGQWRPGPGAALPRILAQWFPKLGFIAEDLGEPLPDLKRLMRESGLPGMEVLQFAFSGEPDNPYLPHNHTRSAVCYVGTHDNATLAQWVHEAAPAERRQARAYFGIGRSSLQEALLRAGMASVSALFVSCMQDWLEIGAEGRMNRPGTVFGNWRWRMRPDALDQTLAARIREMTGRYGRLEEKA